MATSMIYNTMIHISAGPSLGMCKQPYDTGPQILKGLQKMYNYTPHLYCVVRQVACWRVADSILPIYTQITFSLLIK